uniref:SJCHGC09793 protein n=1 Tax=Schistosoma japonicum TaxID=6182 RepID=Q5BQV6_SCHJA|nr:SJCHGC09793 protein [Schistosoma japonicum]
MSFIAFTTQITSAVLSRWQSAILPVLVKVKIFQCHNKVEKCTGYTMRMGFEPMHAEHNGLVVRQSNGRAMCRSHRDI